MDHLVPCLSWEDLSVLNPRKPFWTWLLDHTNESPPLHVIVCSLQRGSGETGFLKITTNGHSIRTCPLGTLEMTHSSITEKGSQQEAFCTSVPPYGPGKEKFNIEEENSFNKTPLSTPS